MFAANLEPVDKRDIISEIFDMVNPANPEVITLKGKPYVLNIADLQECGLGGIVINMFADYTGFHMYDSRPQEMV
jgi:hypothetical protein